MSCNWISLTAVTSLTFELPYFTHINIGRKGHERGLGIYALLCWRNRDSLCLHLCPGGLSLVLQSLEAESFREEKQQIQIMVS